MFKISFQNVGMDRVTKDVTAHVDTLDEAMIYAKGLINSILGYSGFTVLPQTHHSYIITHHESLVGSFSITKLH